MYSTQPVCGYIPVAWGQAELVGYIEASMLPGGDMDGLNFAPGHSFADRG
jgi:hypothetical protein